MKNYNSKNNEGISPFQSICTALAGTVGTGNITGTALAISIGGCGSIFWLWISGLIGMILMFFEGFLSIKYRYYDSDNKLTGGACAYIEKGCGLHFLAVIHSFLLILASFGMGGMVQSNSISCALKLSFNIPHFLSAIILSAASLYIMLGGIKRISRISEIIVPVMSGFYIFFCMIILMAYKDNILDAFKAIVNNSLKFDAINGSLLGLFSQTAIREGLSKGIFSSEAGLGTSSLAHSASTNNNPFIQGLIGSLQVFIDTIVISTLTAFVILSSPLYDLSLQKSTNSSDGLLLVDSIFRQIFGNSGSVLLSLFIILFAFATISAWSVFGMKAFEYVFKEYRLIYIMLFGSFIFIGSISNVYSIWSFSEAINYGLLTVNLSAMSIILYRLLCRTLP